MNSARPLRLLHVTDPHLFEHEGGEIYGVTTAASFRGVIAAALDPPPGPVDAVLVTGDIAEDGARGTYERFGAEMSRLGLPVLCIPGNHENPELLAAVISDSPLQYCGAMSLPGWRVVMLDSHMPGAPEGYLAGDELARLDRELEGAAGAHVLVGLHHQPVPIGSPWLDAVGLRNAEAFLEHLGAQGNVRGVIWGHVHQAYDRVRDGIRMLSTPSTCAQFTPCTERCIMDLRPPGYRWIELMPDGSIATEVAWLEQLRRGERPPDSRQET
jgi:Icc protein